MAIFTYCYLLSTIWNSDAMAGAQAAILEHKSYAKDDKAVVQMLNAPWNHLDCYQLLIFRLLL